MTTGCGLPRELDGPLRGVEDPLDLAQEHLARGRELHASRAAVHESHAHLALELLQLLAHGRLAYEKPLRGTAEVEFFGDHAKNLELAEVHGWPYRIAFALTQGKQLALLP